MIRLFEQLRKRNVLRTLLTYLALSWVLLQIVDLISSIIDLPDATLKVLAGILALGILPVAIFSWVYEFTPDGLKKESDVSDEAHQQHIGGRLNLAVIVLVSLAIVLLVVDRFVVPERGVTSESVVTSDLEPAAEDDGKIDSIAVLPFSDFSPEGDQAYLGDGIADTVLHLLAGVDGLRVAARTSSFRFRDQDADIATIGQQLDVESVLEGSVQVAGDQLRIIAQLVRSSDQSHIWSMTFDRSREDIFAIQDEIANAVVAEFSREDNQTSGPLASQRTSPEVYATVLQARQLVRNRTAPNIEQGIELLNRAIAADPTYASAHSEMAAALYFSTVYGTAELDVIRPRIESEIETALQLDPNDSNAHAIRGVLRDEADEFEAAKADYERALEINPSDVETMGWLADLYRLNGESDRAHELLRRAYEIDPLNVSARTNYSLFLVEDQNDIDAAIALGEETVALNLNPGQANRALSLLYMRVSRLADTTRAMFESVKAEPNSPASYVALTFWLGFMEDQQLFDRWLEVATEMLPSLARSRDFFIRSYMGDAETLLEELEYALEESPESLTVLADVSDVASRLGHFERALETGERYLEIVRTSGPQHPMTHLFMLSRMAAINRRNGDMEESRFFINMMNEMADAMTARSEEGSGASTIFGSWTNLAAGNFDAAANLLEEAEVGKPILYQNIRLNAVFSDSHENPRIRRWLDEYTALIASEREKIQQIEDPAFHNPRLLLEAAKEDPESE